MKTLIFPTTILLSAIVIFTFGFIIDPNKDYIPNAVSVLDGKKFDANNIESWFSNDGRFNYDFQNSGAGGFIWPRGSNKKLTYLSGIWLSGIVGSDTLVAIGGYTPEYRPGYIDQNGIPQGENDPAYRVYKIIKGDTTSIDYLNWPVSQGAYLDSLNKPFLPGMQSMFYSMSDGYTAYHTYTAPMKAQIQVTNWCYSIASDLNISNAIFSEFKIINKNSISWNDAFISLWADECYIEQVAIGCDTNLNLGYAYCQSNSPQYGHNPPAFGYVVLQGPVKYTGNINDTVYSYIPGKNQRRVRVGYKETKLSSFNMMQNNSLPYGQPTNYKEFYLTMEGFMKTGESWINPITNVETKYAFSGDPESGAGWNQYNTMGFGNRRLLMNYGPINISPGDTQTILFAQLVGQGFNNRNSVSQLKHYAQLLHYVFNQNFTTVGINGTNGVQIPSDFTLHQNYPNPFNPETIISYDLKVRDHVLLKVYNISGKEISTLVNEIQNAGSYKVKFNAGDLPSGIYFYKIQINSFSKTLKMIFMK